MRSSARWLAGLSCALLFACKGACSKDDDDPNKEAQFPTTGVKPHPLAERICKALHELPARRAAECCKTQPALHFEGKCVPALSQSLNDDSIVISEADVAKCEAAMTKIHEGCEWIGPNKPQAPPECTRIVQGKLEQGAKCRSALECKSGLRCGGSSVNDPGACVPAGADGALCNTGLDGLAAYGRQDAYELDHPQCTGYCERVRCKPAIALGADCQKTEQCGRGNRCSAGKCVAGEHANAGEPCLIGDCAYGLRCRDNVCVAPKELGEACTIANDCRADCLAGKCVIGCGLAPAVLRDMATKTKTASAAR